MTGVRGARVVTPEGVLDDGWVQIRDGLITAVGGGEPPGSYRDLGGGWLLPGFVDLHVHGGGGFDVTTSQSAMTDAVAFHRSHGTTTMLVSLMAQPVDALCEQLEWVAALTRAGMVAGAHVEGPFLAEERCGAQRPENLLSPDPLVLRKLLAAAQGCLRTMTLAPELPGALDVIGELAANDVRPAIGHTAATYEQAVAGFRAGAVLATHLFNAMGPVDHRAPGAAVAALEQEAFVELINDGQHVHPALVRLVARTHPRTTVFVTDAISAAGAGDGEYTLGDQPVVVSQGRARLATSDRLAGSTLTMDEAFRRARGVQGLSMPAAAALTAGNAARLLRLDDRIGAIRPGRRAELVHVDDDLGVREVLR